MQKMRDMEMAKAMWESGEMQREIDIQESERMWADGSMEDAILANHGEDILGNFYNDTSAQTNAKLDYLDALGLDTSDLRADVQGMRDQLQGDDELEVVGSAIESPIQEAGIFSGLLDAGKELFDKVKNWLGFGTPEPMTPQEIQQLTDSLNQSGTDAEGNPTLLNEINEAIGNIDNNSDLDPNSIRNDACVALALYTDLRLSGADVGSFADFYADNVNAGNIQGDNAYVHNKDAIVSQYDKELVRVTDYDEFLDLGGSDQINNGVVRIDDHHNLNLYRANEAFYTSDVGRRANHGLSHEDLIGVQNFTYFEYLR